MKAKVIGWIQALPDDCTLEEIRNCIGLREKIEQGLADIEAGRVVSQEEAERRSAEWLKSFGRNPH